MVALVGDLVYGAAGDGGVGLGVGDRGVHRAVLELVVLFDEEPVGLVGGAPARAGAGFGARAHAHERPLAVHLGAVHYELERACAESFGDVFVAGLRVPGALVPDHDSAAAVLAFGDDALEAAVFHGVVFDLDGEAAVAGVVAGTLGDGPGFEDAVPAEAEVVVEVRGGVLLDDEGKAVRFVGGGRFGACVRTGGFGGDFEVTHGAVARELFVHGVGGGCGLAAWCGFGG